MSSFPSAKGGELESDPKRLHLKAHKCSSALAWGACALQCIQQLVEGRAARSPTASRKGEKRWDKTENKTKQTKKQTQSRGEKEVRKKRKRK